MYENLIIIFPPGSGGNHLANLIALCGKFSRDVDYNQYDSISHNAHFAPIRNLNISASTWPTLRYQNNILCCHLAEYLWNKEIIETHLTNRKYLMIEMHGADESVRQRMQRYYPLDNRYLWEESSTLYSSQYFSRLTDEHDFFYVNIQSLIDANVVPLIDNLKVQLGIDIDLDRAQYIHSQWYRCNFGENTKND